MDEELNRLNEAIEQAKEQATKLENINNAIAQKLKSVEESISILDKNFTLCKDKSNNLIKLQQDIQNSNVLVENTTKTIEEERKKLEKAKEELKQTQDLLDINKVWNYYQHADNLVASRTNFFLVAQSMLVVAYATILAYANMEVKEGYIHIRSCVILLGILYALIWFYTNTSIYTKMKVLGEKLKKAPIYGKYEENSLPYWLNSGCLIVYILPISTIMLWDIFLLSEQQSYSNTCIIILTVLLELAILINFIISKRKKHEIDKTNKDRLEELA